MDQWRGHVWISLSWHRPWLSVYTVPLSAPATGSPLHGAWRPRRVYCFLLIDAYILGLWQWDGNGIWQRAIDVSAVILRQHSADSTHPTVAKRRRPAVHTATTAVSNSVNIRQSPWPSTRLKGRHYNVSVFCSTSRFSPMGNYTLLHHAVHGEPSNIRFHAQSCQTANVVYSEVLSCWMLMFFIVGASR